MILVPSSPLIKKGVLCGEVGKASDETVLAITQKCYQDADKCVQSLLDNTYDISNVTTQSNSGHMTAVDLDVIEGCAANFLGVDQGTFNANAKEVPVGKYRGTYLLTLRYRPPASKGYSGFATANLEIRIRYNEKMYTIFDFHLSRKN